MAVAGFTILVACLNQTTIKTPTTEYIGLPLIQENSVKAISLIYNAPLTHYSASYASLMGEGEYSSFAIEKLNKCENHGDWVCRKILDINNKYSYGGLQFQLATFWGMGKKYSVLPQTMTMEEAREYICDRDLQTIIATYMIKNGEGKRAWYNCWLKMKL